MMIFYNEIDPFAAAWLRELIKADVIDKLTSTQVLLGCSSFCQEGGGMLDIIPILCRAIFDSLSFCAHQAVHALVCGQFRPLFFLHKTRKYVEQMGCLCKIAPNFLPATPSLLSLHDILIPFQGVLCEILAHSLRCLRVCILVSKAIYCAVMMILEKLSRTPYKHAPSLFLHADAFCSISPYTLLNNTCDDMEMMQGVQRHTQCSFSC